MWPPDPAGRAGAAEAGFEVAGDSLRTPRQRRPPARNQGDRPGCAVTGFDLRPPAAAKAVQRPVRRSSTNSACGRISAVATAAVAALMQAARCRGWTLDHALVARRSTSAGCASGASRSRRLDVIVDPPPVQVQGLRQAVLRYERHDLPRPQAGDPRLPDGLAIFANAAKASAPAARPRPRRVLQDGVRAGPQAPRGDGAPIRRSTGPRAKSRSTAPTSAATASRPTSRPTGSTAACRASDRQAPGRGRDARAPGSHAAVRGQGRG